MNWKEISDGHWQAGPYDIWRNIKDYSLYRFDGKPKLIKKARTRLECEVAATLDMFPKSEIGGLDDSFDL